MLLAAAPSVGPRLTADEQTALDHIRADSLRGNLSFLASDLLEGRNTPSRGLDIAAEYIAAQFRRAGLEPAFPDRSYFQTVPVERVDATARDVTLYTDDDRRAAADPTDLRAHASAPLTLNDARVYKVALGDAAALSALDPAALRHKVVLLDFGPGQWGAWETLWLLIERSEADAVVITGERGRALVDPGDNLFVPSAERPIPRVSVSTDAVTDLCRSLKPGPAAARISLRIDVEARTESTAKNVGAILGGSDPALSRTCVVLSAHYDHLGLKSSGPGDRIFSGANDDGSGTVSVIEIGAALAAMATPPRRSVVFVTFFGEEEGLYGSQYFAQHLPCPPADTLADINLEQLGRPDTDKGRIENAIAFTGNDFTTIPGQFASSAEATGVAVAKDAEIGDDFYARSDNFSLAIHGIPANTVAVPAMFADYHAVGDKWEKIDYRNMSRLDRTIALGLIRIADDPHPPEWNSHNDKTAGYLAEWRRVHGNAPASVRE